MTSTPTRLLYETVLDPPGLLSSPPLDIPPLSHLLLPAAPPVVIVDIVGFIPIVVVIVEIRVIRYVYCSRRVGVGQIMHNSI